MDMENGKGRERVELSLDGRQIASIVVGALVLLGVVFVLGLNLGKQLGARQVEAGRGDVLAGLDRPPPAPATPISDDALTFHDRLTKDKPPIEEPVVRPPPAAPKPATQPATTTATARPTPAAATAAASSAPAAPPPSATANALRNLAGPGPSAAASSGPPAPGSFTVQLISTSNRAEADRLAGKLAEFDPRVESAEVTGKGKVFRVRVGGYDNRAEAERVIKAIAAKAGTKGMVVTIRAK
jgi:cell division septation protein DedD